MDIRIQKELLHLGNIFKKCRESKNLSLREVEMSTSVRTTYLLAIEEGKMNKLISPIYAQGFIKKYAEFLELDGESLLNEYPYLMKMLKERHVDNLGFSFNISSLEMRSSPEGEIKWVPNLIWVGISGFLFFFIWFIGRCFGIF